MGASGDRIQLGYRGTEAGSQDLRQRAHKGHRRGCSSLGWVGLELEMEQETRGSQTSGQPYWPRPLSALRSRNWEGPDAGRSLRSSLEVIGEQRH